MKPEVSETVAASSPTPDPSASPNPSPSAVPPSPVATAGGVPVAAPSTAVPSSDVPAHHLPSPIPEKSFVPPKVPLVLAPSPVPAPSPSAPPNHSVPPVPSPSPSPAPAPVPTVSPTAAVLSTAEEDLKKDPLQSGTNYPPKEIQTKVVLRTKADVWVRYRCDEKRLMKFALKKDKILVLRGKKAVYLQVSNPDSITLQATGQVESLFSQNAGVFDYHGTPSVAFPPQAREKIEENFKVGNPLPATDSPSATE